MNKTIPAFIAVMLTMLLVAAGCAKQSPAVAPEEQMPQPVMQEQPAVAPEIAQAEQSVDEIGTSDLGEMEQETDQLIIP